MDPQGSEYMWTANVLLKSKNKINTYLVSLRSWAAFVNIDETILSIMVESETEINNSSNIFSS